MKLFLAVLFSIVSGIASALDMKEVIVSVRVGDKATNECGLSAKSFEAQLETVLRQNQIKIKSSGTGPYFFLSVYAQEDNSSNCWGHFYLQVYTWVANPNLGWTKEKSTGVYEHCLTTSAFQGGKGFQMQEKINSALSDSARQCISKVLKE